MEGEEIMARQGISPEKIRAVITQLQAQGEEPTVSAIREQLGSGSYTTISSELSRWRIEQAQATRPAIPEIPDSVHHVAQHFWVQAWKAADNLFEKERHSVAQERADFERGRA